MLSLFFEITQLTGLYFIYPYAYRVFDVDDLIINTLGGIIGYALMGIIDDYLPTREEIDNKSLKNSMTVSGLRRIAIFYLDSFLFISIFLLLSLFLQIRCLLLIVFVIYYIFVPYMTNGYTLGSKFLNVRLYFEKNRLVNIVFRIVFLFTYYYGIMFFSMYLLVFIRKMMNLNVGRTLLLFALGITMALLFYIVNALILLVSKKHFYDKLFKVSYVSTIKVE